MGGRQGGLLHAAHATGAEGAIGKVYRSTGSHWKDSLAPSMLAGRIHSVA